MKKLSVKAMSMSASLTLALTAKAAQMRSEGIDVISFGAGEPDFNTPKNVRDAAHTAIEEGKNKYTAASGLLELKNLVCEKFKKDNNLEYKPENIIISTGAKQCLTNIFTALLNPKDEVIMASPYWVSYPELISLADGISIFANTSRENDFKLTAKDIQENITSNTKAIVINSPNNPTGAIYTKRELEEIADICKKNDLYIISDEIYEKLNYDIKNNPHISIASLNDDAFARTIVINGFSKSHAMTGWRLGYAAANKEITKLMSTIQSHTTSNPNTMTQYAGIEALKGNKDELNEMIKAFARRRDLMNSLIKEIKEFDCINPMGAFYCFIDISKLFNNKIKNSMEFAAKLLDEENVVVIPGSAFGKDNYIRLSYATSDENILNGLKRIKDFVNNIL
ncbi:MAG: pyridoxal phosphate-dependent aminotransferase [Sarcina sp.]